MIKAWPFSHHSTLAIFSLFFFAYSSAHAFPSFDDFGSSSFGSDDDGVIFQPYVGVESGTIKQTEVSEISVRAPIVGAQVGYRYSDFETGVLYSRGFGNAEQGPAEGDYKPTDMGVFLGYFFPLDLHLYAAYLFSAKAEIQSEENPEAFSGSGKKYGLRWGGLSFCDVSLELLQRKYSKYSNTEMAKPLESSTISLMIGFSL